MGIPSGAAAFIRVSVTASDRVRLEVVLAARGSPQKYVWRAHTILPTDQGLITNAIMASTSKSKTCVWRWQKRFMAEDVESLPRDKTLPAGISPLDAVRADKVVTLACLRGYALDGAGHCQSGRHRRVLGGEELARSRLGAPSVTQLQAVQ